MQSSNGQTSERDCRKPKGNYTGERVKLLRPETYRRVVRLLAEPREYVSIREICRQCHVTDDTVKAIEKCEAVPIAARKQTLLLQAARIAKLAADRVEDQIGDAPLQQSVVTFGVMTDKIIALSAENMQTLHHIHSFDLGDDDIVAFSVALSHANEEQRQRIKQIGIDGFAIARRRFLPAGDALTPENNGA